MARHLEVVARPVGGARVIEVTGDVDVSSVEDLQAHIDAAFAAGERFLVVDLARVTFVDSSVLHALFRALRRARRAGGDIAVVCVDPKLCRVLQVFGLTSEVGLYEGAGEAVAALVAPGND